MPSLKLMFERGRYLNNVSAGQKARNELPTYLRVVEGDVSGHSLRVVGKLPIQAVAWFDPEFGENAGPDCPGTEGYDFVHDPSLLGDCTSGAA